MKIAALFVLAVVLLAREAASQPTQPTTAPENYAHKFSSPTGCAPSSCTIFAGVNLNQGDSDYVDIYLEGTATGYVSIGFSQSRSMFNTDVVACTRDSSNNMIQALDTWNPTSFRGNQRDPTMEADLTMFSGEFVNGRIRCLVAKRIIGSDTTQDINLNSNLYLLHASGNSISSTTAILRHNTRAVSSNTFSFPPPAIVTTPPPTTQAPTTTEESTIPTTEGQTTPTTEETTTAEESTIPTTEGQTTPTTEETTTVAGPTTEVLMTTVSSTMAETTLSTISELTTATQPEATTAPEGVVPPSIQPEDSRLIFRQPAGCVPSECDIFVGINTNSGNSGYLDIFLEGEASGWVAVGFSETRSMFSADVVACVRDPNIKIVSALDNWNPSSTRISDRDPTQDVVLFEGRAANGRITCRVAKRIIGSDAVQDINLNNDLYVLFTRRIANAASSSNIAGSIHDTLPVKTEQRYNPTVDETPLFTTAQPRTATQPEATTAPEGVVPPSIQPEDSRLIFRQPAGCVPSECDIFVGINTNTGNSGYLDIFLEGEASGWVAVGFSETQNMFSADVVACTRVPASGMVTALDNWNLAPPDRGSEKDPTQDIVLFEGTAENGRIQCSVAKPIIGSDADRDLNLDDDLYVLLARREALIQSGSGSNILTSPHDSIGNRFMSDNLTNPVTAGGERRGEGVAAVRNALTRAHGILMLLAWPLLALSGIFFASWMKPALPNGEWFQVHRAFMVASLFIGAAGFILIFVANQDSSPQRGLIDLSSENKTGRAHFAIGIIVMFLHILNPLLALFRCKPGHKFRWIFNIIHGTSVGLLVELLALANVGIGLSIFSDNFSRFQELEIFWVFIAFLVFSTLLVIVMFITLAGCARHQKDEKEQVKTSLSGIKALVSGMTSRSPSKPKKGEYEPEVELDVMSGDKLTPVEEKDTKKPPSKDSPLRWVFLAVLWVVLIPVVIALIVLVALP